MAHDKLIKVDKNGTEYWADYTCRRCGGIGGANQWKYTGWKCYECGGSGITDKPDIYKKYTPEYEAKLNEKRAKRASKKMAELKAKENDVCADWLLNNQFDTDGYTYVFTGNTYDIKELLKNMGAKYNPVLGWHYHEAPSGYTTSRINIDEIAEKTPYGYQYKVKASEIVKALIKQDEPEQIPSEYIGTVGEKITVNAVYVHTFDYETNYGYGYWQEQTKRIHQFKVGNDIIVWNTTLYIDADYGEIIKITGTVKEHSEYKGQKQTVLTRCKCEKGDAPT